MHPPVSAARWAAIRALCEGAPPAFPLVAAVTKLHPSTIRERASMENWAKPNFQSSTVRAACAGATASALAPAPMPADESEALPEGWMEMSPRERLEWLNAFVTSQVAQIAAAAEGGALDKPRMDGLWSMIRMVEKSGTLAQEPAADTKTGSDAELAGKLELLDDRIVELAVAHAEWLVGERDRQRLD